MLNPVKNRRYTDHIVEQLKEYVLSRELPPGERLPSDAVLSEAFGVSRGTIREALHMLEHDGVVTIKKGPGGGIFVSEGNFLQVVDSIFYALRWEQISEDSFHALIETRKTPEDRIARLAAERADQEDLSALEAILDLMEAPGIDHASFARYDTDLLTKLEEQGMEVNDVDQKPFRDRMSSAWDKLLEKAPEAQGYLDRILKTQ